MTCIAKTQHPTLHLDGETDQDDDGNTGPSIPKAPKHYSWLNDHLDEADHTRITVVKNWKAWSQKHDEDKDTMSWFARGASLMALRIVMEQLPTYTDNDFLVVNRASKDGKQHSQEVWTLKKFNPGEIILAPVSHILVDKLWTKQACASVLMPERGPFAWPTRRTVAFDGRYKGPIDKDGHGSLFWSVTRTEDASKANLALDRCEVTFSQVDVTLPLAKRQRVSYLQKDSPHISVLVNHKVIKKNTLLVALEDKIVRAAQEPDKDERLAKAKAAASSAQAKPKAKGKA